MMSPSMWGIQTNCHCLQSAVKCNVLWASDEPFGSLLATGQINDVVG